MPTRSERASTPAWPRRGTAFTLETSQDLELSQVVLVPHQSDIPEAMDRTCLTSTKKRRREGRNGAEERDRKRKLCSHCNDDYIIIVIDGIWNNIEDQNK